MTGHFQLSLRALLVMALMVCVWLAVQFSRKPAPQSKNVDAKRILNVREVLDESFSDSNVIRFLSWNGQWIGTDCDTEIQLAADGTAVLIEYQDAIDRYDGTYSISEDAELTLSLVGYRAEWPTMRVYRDNSVLLLIPAPASPGNGVEWHGPAVVSGFWPFCQLPESRF